VAPIFFELKAGIDIDQKGLEIFIINFRNQILLEGMAQKERIVIPDLIRNLANNGKDSFLRRNDDNVDFIFFEPTQLIFIYNGQIE
jgi:hypothetical protein